MHSWRQHLLCPSHTAFGKLGNISNIQRDIKNFTWNTHIYSITHPQRQIIIKHVWISQGKSWAKEVRHKRVHTMPIPFLLCSQSDRVVRGVRNQNSVYFGGRKKEVVFGCGHMAGFWRAGKVLFLDLGMGVFTRWKLIELYLMIRAFSAHTCISTKKHFRKMTLIRIA